jgi:ribosome-associated protein
MRAYCRGRTTLTAKTVKKPAKRVVKKKVAPKKAAAKTAKTKKAAAPAKKPASPQSVLLGRILKSLDDDKAQAIVPIDLNGRSSLCDWVVVASGTSSRHVASTAEHLVRRLKEAGYGPCHTDGTAQGDWALVDAGDVIVHIFRPEVRVYYDIEGMWSVPERIGDRPKKRARA